jgi:MFS family permease
MMTNDSPTVCQRRRARRLAVWNGAIWAVGNALVSTTLIIYWARELHAAWIGLGIGLIGAAPQIVGLLRLGTPAMIARMADRKRFCIAAYLLAVWPLAAIPPLCKPGLLPSPSWSLACLILLWCLHQLLQYLATVALFSWLADVAPTRIRGRFLGWRQRWIMAGTAVAVVIAGIATSNAHEHNSLLPEITTAISAWVSYALVMGLGAAFLLAALAPLGRMPSCQRERIAPRNDEARWTAPFRDARFLRLLAFGCWFSFFNGITQSAQGYYPMHVLEISLFVSLLLPTGMNLGQWAVSPWLGRMADRLGNRRVMFVSQLIVAAGLLFFALATPSQWWWLVGAWTLWIAYAGLNVCLPNLMLKLAPREANASYIAAFQAASGLCFAASAILGGILLDSYKGWTLPLGKTLCLSFFPCLFIFGWLMRSLGAILLLWVIEPTTELPKRQCFPSSADDKLARQRPFST